MSVERVIPVVASVLVIVLVAVVQARSRHLAAILATMPLTAPLAMWIVFSASGGDHRQTAEFSRSMWWALLPASSSCWRAGAGFARGGASR